MKAFKNMRKQETAAKKQELAIFRIESEKMRREETAAIKQELAIFRIELEKMRENTKKLAA